MINNKKYVDDVGIKAFADKVKEKNTKQDESIDSLKHRSSQMEETIESIAATGGASQATAVTYNNEKSKLTAINMRAWSNFSTAMFLSPPETFAIIALTGKQRIYVNTTPISPANKPMINVSALNTLAMSRFLAPMLLRTPISFVLSTTET